MADRSGNTDKVAVMHALGDGYMSGGGGVGPPGDNR
jgi:hypothetical protein